ncbi:MAG: STAS domain-containing protein [Actinomycetota bacterium]|nr:STAS domain-containing protein [Actinomycetota bacterium]
MHGIEAVDHGAGVTVGMRGEFDAHSLPDLREALDHVCSLGKPVVVDLSGVTFLDLQSARELVVRSVIQAHQLAFESPSPGVLASIRALGIDHQSRIHSGHEEPPVFSKV